MVASGAAGGVKHALGEQGERLGTGAQPAGFLGQRRPALVVVAAYVGVGAAAAGVSLILGFDPVACDGWLRMRGAAAALSSAGMGVCIGAATVAATRAMVRRAAWARALHAALRPAVHGAGDGTLLALALASAIGEELLFRGLLVPLVGVVFSSIVFGALHQIRGQARWWWMGWATGMGLLFAVVYRATGSLLGPVIAHAAINAANLRYLRDNDPSPRHRPLGGLLKRPTPPASRPAT
jgi:membrane protease YdiL (CAAX protease family)